MKLAFLIIAFGAGAAAYSQIVVRVEVNGIPATYDGTPPQILDGRVLVPVRSVFEQLGATVTWNEAEKVITSEKEGHTIWMKIGESTALRDDVPVILDVPPQIIEGYTLVPVRFISEAMGAKVQWNGLEKLVSIETVPPPSGERAPTASTALAMERSRPQWRRVWNAIDLAFLRSRADRRCQGPGLG